jgi:hypothetical protein
MSHLQLVTTNSPVLSHQEMKNDHKKVLQNHLDRLRSRGYSEKTMSDTRWFTESWFEPRWSPQNRPYVVTSKPANGVAAGDGK